METINDFNTTLLKAQNDNWDALEKLRKWTYDKSDDFSEIARNSYVKIQTDYAPPFMKGYAIINELEHIKTSQLLLDELVTIVLDNKPIYHPLLVNNVNENENISKKTKLSFYIYILKMSNSINAKSYAENYFTK